MIKTAIILAAGMGERLDDTIKKDKPKGFVAIKGQTLIERSIYNLKSMGISNIIIGTGYLSNYYEALKDTQSIFCVKNYNYSSTGSFYTLYNLREYINDDFLLLESDLLYERRALTILMNHHKKNIILASGKTNSSDEVFIEVDKNNNLHSLSKNKNMLSNIYGELVGISKVSLGAYGLLCNWAEKNVNQRKIIHYEEALVEINNKANIFVEKIDDLVWTEIDTKEHYVKAVNYVYPELLKKENA